MQYSIRALSELAGVSARTLRYYDEIGLLKPLYTDTNGQRYYGSEEVNMLQQILFYRERGFGLKEIGEIISGNNYDILTALKDHLLELEEKRIHMEALIQTVKQTILSMEGDYEMSDTEKFQVFKEKTVADNEEAYGKEIRSKYGEKTVDASNRKLLNMTETEWKQFKQLEKNIKNELEKCVLSGERMQGESAKKIVQLHKEWLSMTWKSYTPQAHKGVAALYEADGRFKAYYDEHVEGCAAFISGAVGYWADKL